MTDKAPKKRQTLQTLERGLRLLGCFNDKKPEWGVTELATHMGLSKTVVHRIIVTLEQMGYLSQNEQNKKYRLGLKVFELGIIAANQLQLRQVAKPIMERLAADTGETVNLTVLDPPMRAGICIETVESSQQIKLTTRIGNVGPLHRGASRKILLAYLDPEERDRYLEPSVIGTPLSEEEKRDLADDLAVIREQGYAVSQGEVDPDAFAVSAPIYDAAGSVVAGLTVSGPRYRTEADRLKALTHLVCAGARDVSRRLGWAS